MSDPIAISVVCNECDRGFRVKSFAAGRKVKCPGCRQPVLIPAEPKVTPPPAIEFEANGPQAPPEDFLNHLSSHQAEPVPQPTPFQQHHVAEAYQTPPDTPLVTASSNVRIRSSSFLPRQYPALKIACFILRGLAILLLAICLVLLLLVLVGFVGSLAGDSYELSGAILGVGLLWSVSTSLPLLLAALMLFSYAELIAVFMDIQHNTQEAAHHLRQRS